MLDDGSKTLPAAIHVVTDEPERTVLEMTIREGKTARSAVCAKPWAWMSSGCAVRHWAR